jgi:predicted transcriptional regulator
MKQPIIEVLLSSEKRKKVLLLLQNGPREMKTLLESLKTTRAALLPQMKILKESHLISQNEDTYESTTVGKLIVEEMITFLRTASMFGGNDYLGTHYIDFIPSHLLKKLPEIGSLDIIDIDITDLFSQDKELFKKAAKSKYWLEVTSILYPDFHYFYTEMLGHEIDISIIITQDVYDKAKHDYYESFKEIMDLRLISMYLYPESMEFASFIVTDGCVSFRLLTHEGVFDNKKMHICGPAASECGKELFEYYRQQSTLITEI